jgi:hypothetical protein
MAKIIKNSDLEGNNGFGPENGTHQSHLNGHDMCAEKSFNF